MHVLCGLRGDQARQCLSELRRRLVPRPIRPATERRPGVSVQKHPPSDKRMHLKYSLDDIAAHSARLRDIPPEER
jgi:hypothetical protein